MLPLLLTFINPEEVDKSLSQPPGSLGYRTLFHQLYRSLLLPLFCLPFGKMSGVFEELRLWRNSGISLKTLLSLLNLRWTENQRWQWVMDQIRHEYSMGHMGHRSRVNGSWPLTRHIFKTAGAFVHHLEFHVSVHWQIKSLHLRQWMTLLLIITWCFGKILILIVMWYFIEGAVLWFHIRSILNISFWTGFENMQ